MKTNPPSPDDPFLHQQLRRLNDPAAPPDLIPSVLARLRPQETKVWWRSPVFDWPWVARLGAAVLLLAVVGLAYYGIGWASSQVGVALEVDGTSEKALSTPQLLVMGLSACLKAITGSVAAIPTLIWWGMISVGVTVYLGCLGIGTLVYRQVASRSS